MSVFARSLRLLKRPPVTPLVPSIAEVVAACRVPVFGLDSEVQGLRFKTFSYSADEVEFLYQRRNAAGFGPGILIASRTAAGDDTERFLDLLIRAAAQSAALAFSPQEFRQAQMAGLNDLGNPFAMLDDYPLSGQVAEINLGDSWKEQVTIWQWHMPQPLRALVLRRANPIVIASYDIPTENLVQCLTHIVPVSGSPELIDAHQREFDDHKRVTIDHSRPAKQ